ncbi:hypothetical protein J4470_00450 [Candidatus Woesearchaeota archaeon]|nr:hypothetical protein [Candidatus Woesearchaeota archaeon]
MIKNLAYWLVFSITVAAALTGIIMVIYKVTGHSPTVEEALLMLSVAITGLLINHMKSTSKFEGHARAELTTLRRDVEEMKRDLKLLTSKRARAT